jgi:hypothetical protein
MNASTSKKVETIFAADFSRAGTSRNTGLPEFRSVHFMGREEKLRRMARESRLAREAWKDPQTTGAK